MLEIKNDIENISKVEINDEKAPTYYCYFYFIDSIVEEDKIKAYDKILTTVGFEKAELREDCIYLEVYKGK